MGAGVLFLIGINSYALSKTPCGDAPPPPLLGSELLGWRDEGRRPNVGPKMREHGPEMNEHAPEKDPRGPQMRPGWPMEVKHGSEMARDGPRSFPDEAKTAQDGPKMGPRWPKQIGPRS